MICIRIIITSHLSISGRRCHCINYGTHKHTLHENTCRNTSAFRMIPLSWRRMIAACQKETKFPIPEHGNKDRDGTETSNSKSKETQHSSLAQRTPPQKEKCTSQYLGAREAFAPCKHRRVVRITGTAVQTCVHVGKHIGNARYNDEEDSTRHEKV
jgi:hypothetical protein